MTLANPITYADQYINEMCWSNKMAESIIMEDIQDSFPEDISHNLHETISDLNTTEVDSATLCIKLLCLLLVSKKAQPIQAIAIQLGHTAKIKDTIEAFHWGLMVIKAASNSGLYQILNMEGTYLVKSLYTISSSLRKKLDKLQYMPPMKVKPIDWHNNHDGGWTFDNKHLLLGNKYTKHNRPQAYDVINKLQRIPFRIDEHVFREETQTNKNINKRKFLRVVNDYLGQDFYFVWRYDSRGRSYSSGYDLNIQGTEYDKAMLSLARKEKIHNLENLYIAIANHAGKDKLTWEERIDWTCRALKDVENIEWEEPILGRKAIRALKDTILNDNTGYMMSLDATSSGIQIMAALSGCKDTATLTNIVDPNQRYDVYTECTNRMNCKLKSPVKVKRSVIKKCLMTKYYNSIAIPKALLTPEQLEVFLEVTKGLLPGAEKVMDTINNCWQYNKDHHAWVMPDGHHVYVPVTEGMYAEYNDAHLGGIPIHYYAQKSSTNSRSLAPNIIHSIDGYIAREMLRKCNFQLVHIHDSFWFNPNYLQDVAQTYREIMAEIARSDLLLDILKQITGNPSFNSFEKYTSNLSEYILGSSYMLS